MRKLLDGLYLFAGWLAALCLIAIALMVGVQVVGRIVDSTMRALGFAPYGFIVEGLAEIAGYLLAVSSLLALAAALKAGAHIRVTMVLSALPVRARRIVETCAFGAAFIMSAYMTWRLGALALDSWRFNEVSYGLVPLPLAWPQAAMAFGLLVLTIALLDEFLTVLREGRASFQAQEDAITLGKEG
ncbi:MAG: TRAP transporter small permease [Hyphomicrobiaceae bacterium]|jgi:TRAP-type C4-dicarboxylate transport system permease small subunit